MLDESRCLLLDGSSAALEIPQQDPLFQVLGVGAEVVQFLPLGHDPLLLRLPIGLFRGPAQITAAKMAYAVAFLNESSLTQSVMVCQVVINAQSDLH